MLLIIHSPAPTSQGPSSTQHFSFHLEIFIDKTKILIFLLKFYLLFFHQSLLLMDFITHSRVPSLGIGSYSFFFFPTAAPKSYIF